MMLCKVRPRLLGHLQDTTFLPRLQDSPMPSACLPSIARSPQPLGPKLGPASLSFFSDMNSLQARHPLLCSSWTAQPSS
jgi:hypothetical protein